MWTFYLHYNKPASQAAKRPLMSVHFRDRCHIVDGIQCDRPTYTKHSKRQPRVTMAGKATSVTVRHLGGCFDDRGNHVGGLIAVIA